MAAEIRLSDGTTIKTSDSTTSTHVIHKLQAERERAYVAIDDDRGKVYRVSNEQVVYVRDLD